MLEINKIIYHSNFKIVKDIKIAENKYLKDFSTGFYCTNDKSQAEMNARKFETAIINIYLIKDVKGLKVKIFKNYSDEWLDFIYHCKNGYKHDYDIVIGQQSDDIFHECVDAYRAGEMNKEYFYKMMRKKQLGFQISFNTVRALEKLIFLKGYKI